MTAINIESCKECKELSEERDYTPDSWEFEEKGKCKLKEKYVFRYKERRESYPPVPDWCPKRVHKRKKVKNDSRL